MIYRCAVCNTVYLNKGAEPIMRSVPYVGKLDDSYCCALCVEAHDSPGKFEANRGSRGDLAKALILYAWMLDSGEDDFMSSDGYGYCGRFGQYLLFEDERGSVSFWDEGTPEKAQKEFDRLHDDGMGAQEDDFYIQSGRNGYEVWQGHKEIHVWPSRNEDYVTERRARAAISLEMRRTGCFPNVWNVGERGDVSPAKDIW
jgi:hypothetical protein